LRNFVNCDEPFKLFCAIRGHSLVISVKHPGVWRFKSRRPLCGPTLTGGTSVVRSKEACGTNSPTKDMPKRRPLQVQVPEHRCIVFDDSVTLPQADQAAFGPRKGLNLPGAFGAIAFFLSDDAHDRQT
jgi:hypothetical protein